MDDCFIPLYDKQELIKHYRRLGDISKDPCLENFMVIIKEIFSYAKNNWDSALSFKRYIDGETHLSLESAGLKGDHKFWGLRYNLTPDSYNLVRSATIESFVQKSLESIRKNEISPHDLICSLNPHQHRYKH